VIARSAGTTRENVFWADRLRVSRTITATIFLSAVSVIVLAAPEAQPRDPNSAT
jgi:hypothetical protein